MTTDAASTAKGTAIVSRAKQNRSRTSLTMSIEFVHQAGDANGRAKKPSWRIVVGVLIAVGIAVAIVFGAQVMVLITP